MDTTRLIRHATRWLGTFLLLGACALALALPAPKDIEAAVSAGRYAQAETMLRETARVGRIGIVAFPNFAHWPNRLSVLLGRMPVTRRLPYQWYDTPNIRVGTLADFDALARKNGLLIQDAFGLEQGRVLRWMPNARASTAVFVFTR